MNSVLDPVAHDRLIKDIAHVSAVANIPQAFIQQSIVGVCDPTEIQWVKKFRMYRETRAGLVLQSKTEAEVHCMAICGALVRNFIDARVVSLSTLLEGAKTGNAPDPTVLIIPNFFQESLGKNLPAWRVAELYDLLLSRYTAGRPTVVAIDNMDAMGAAYGSSFTQHFASHYLLA
jgi:hypothetical protein